MTRGHALSLQQILFPQQRHESHGSTALCNINWQTAAWKCQLDVALNIWTCEGGRQFGLCIIRNCGLMMWHMSVCCVFALWYTVCLWLCWFRLHVVKVLLYKPGFLDIMTTTAASYLTIWIFIYFTYSYCRIRTVRWKREFYKKVLDIELRWIWTLKGYVLCIVESSLRKIQ